MRIHDLRLRARLEFLRNFARPPVRSRRDLTGYVVRITALSIAIAVGLDVVNQLVFFEGWIAAVRSWLISAAVSGGIAAPISHSVGKAQLELYRAKQELEKLSRTDPLTGLANRRVLIEASEAPPPAALVLVIFDIDRFKRINDAYGHIAGDKVIQAVSDAMVRHLGSLGVLCRLGGEEFALLAPGDRLEDVLDGVWALRDHLASAPLVVGNVSANVTISAGVAVRGPTDSFDRLYSDADRALYIAKAEGRNRISYAEPMREEGERRRWRTEAEASEDDSRSVA